MNRTIAINDCNRDLKSSLFCFLIKYHKTNLSCTGPTTFPILAEYDDGSITKHSLTGTSVTSTNDVSITSYERTCDIFRLQPNSGGSTAAILGSGAKLDDSVSIVSLQTLDGVCDLHGSAEHSIVQGVSGCSAEKVAPGIIGDDDEDDDDDITEKQLSS